jgi:hypothetical protein
MTLLWLAHAATVEVVVAAPQDVALGLETVWDGEDRQAEFSFDNGLHTATLEGERVRQLRLRLDVDGIEGDFDEPILLEDDRLSYALVDGRIRRVALAAPPQQAEKRESRRLIAMFGWTGLVMLTVLGLARR